MKFEMSKSRAVWRRWDAASGVQFRKPQWFAGGRAPVRDSSRAEDHHRERQPIQLVLYAGVAEPEVIWKMKRVS